MGHGKLRHENNCLNCNAIVQGSFCGICGQENVATKESIGQIIRHFFEDITHFDGKFFSSLKFLLFKPGFLSTQYRLGKRASYLNPVRMYIFTSFAFFLLIFTFKNPEKSIRIADTSVPVVQVDFGSASDSSASKKNKPNQSGKELKQEEEAIIIDSVKNSVENEDETLAEYRRRQDTAKVKDFAVIRYFKERSLKIDEKYAGNKKKLSNDGISRFLHSFPQFLFVSLPLVAFLLLTLYSRRKEYNYVNHGIFVIHYYIFIFILSLFFIGISELEKLTNWSILRWMIRAGLIYAVYYLYRAMLNYYQHGKWKTFFKYLLLMLGILFIMLILLVIFMAIAFLFL
jgi:hypothetical protein